MEQWLKEWSSSILDHIYSSSIENKDDYFSPNNIRHFIAVAESLDEAFGNSALTKAGFLHILPPNKLLDYGIENIDENVIKILNDLEKLKAVDLLHPQISQQLLMNIIPTFRDVRSAYILLIDHLDHIDPTYQFREWTQNFKHNPKFASASDLLRHESLGIYNKKNASKSCSIISEIADYLNLRVEKKCLENAALCFENPNALETITEFCIGYSKPGFSCERQIDAIRKSSISKYCEEVHWEWKNAAAIYDKAPKHDPKTLKKFLYSFGHVTVVCKNLGLCYRALHYLHDKFKFHANRVKFSEKLIGLSAKYTEIRTVLKAPTYLKNICNSIPIKIIVEDDAYHLRNMQAEEIRNHGELTETLVKKPKKIITFTPDGKRIKLPFSSTVLNFAHELYASSIVELDGAIINEKRTDDIFTYLNDGDVVYLVYSDSLRPLPNDWEKRIPFDTIASIKLSYKKYLKTVLQEIGREWMSQQLYSYRITSSNYTNTIDKLAKKATDFLDHINVPHPPKDFEKWPKDRYLWWFQQIGIYVSNQIQGLKIENKLFITEDVVYAFLNEMIKQVSLRSSKSLKELNIITNKITDIKSLSYCENCHPNIDDNLIGTVESQTLILHKSNASCGKGGFIVTHKFKDIKPRFFYVKTKNRTGISAEILDVFAQNKIDIIESVGLRISVALGIFRITTGFVEQDLLDLIIKEIKEVNGVLGIYPPNLSPPKDYELWLPPKWEDKSNEHIQEYSIEQKYVEPYTVGQIIRDDWWFYGMGNEKNELLSAFKTIKRDSHQKSIMCFVGGPKRVGKSSLIMSFLRSIQTSEKDLLEIVYEAPLQDCWHEVMNDVFKTIKDSIVNYTKDFNIELPDIEKIGNDTKSWISLINNNLNCPLVFVLDEFIGLAYNSKLKNHADELSKFIHDLRKIKKCMLILAGPHSFVRDHAISIQEILSKSKWVEVKPLNKKEAFKLVQAEKLKKYHNIRVSEPIFKELYSLTSGNPYWLNLICHEIWKRKALNNTLHIENLSLLNHALEIVLSKKVPFTSRTDYANEICILILKFLLSKDANDPRSMKDIHNYLIDYYPELSMIEINRHLEDMKAVGSIRDSWDGQGIAWEIFPKIIHEFVKRYGVLRHREG